MLEIQDEFDPPFEIIEPAECRAPILFNSPHSGRVYPREFLHASRLDLATLRRSEDSFVDDLIAGVVRARLSDDAGALSRAAMSTSTASPTNSIRACSTAGCRPSPIPARCGSPAVSAPSPAWSATPRKSTTSASRSTKRCARIEALYKPYHRALRRLFMQAAPRFRRRHAGRLPFDAVGPGTRDERAAAGPRDRRPLRHQLRRRRRRHDRSDHARLRLFGQPQQALCRRLHHRALRQSRSRPARHPARDQPRALYGRAALRAAPSVCAGSPANSRCWPTGSPKFRWRNCGPIARRRNRLRGYSPAATGLAARDIGMRQKKKGRSPCGSGPSLGRKRPRRAAVARGFSLPHCNNIHRAAQNARPVRPAPPAIFHPDIACKFAELASRYISASQGPDL